jgi:deazaflavin-dependent oxidoreductase (nitroreductase family)
MDKIEGLNRNVVAEFRANGGKVSGPWDSIDLLLLHTVGARSRHARVNPVGYVCYGDDLLIVASVGGAPHHPAWYWNLKAHPRTVIEIGNETVAVVASEVGADEHARLWAIVTEALPVMLEYQTLTTRRLPIFRLSPT